jgi:glycosyltransferase involved in cell wall biosynthesis/tetratricopeptide (TPR) repeat protein
MPIKFYGQQRDQIVNRLVDKWLPGGPPVAILQGFPGCGKSQLARAVATRAPRSLDPVEPPMESPDFVIDLFLDLAIALEAHGLPDMAQEIDKGDKAQLDRALLNLLRHEQILIVVDEFQRLLPEDKSTPPRVWAKLVEDLNNSPHAQGRLLLVSNRVIKTERWSENCQIEELHGLTDEEAELLFSELLEAKGVAEKVSQEERRDIAHRLAGNPRALKTLVSGLRTDTLNDLLSASPDLLQPGDVVLNPRLLEEFERELIERALPKLDDELLKFMRWLSVHRRPFQKDALNQFPARQHTSEALRQQLFDRFLLEQVGGGDSMHPLAREISVSRLRAAPEVNEWKQAHSLAADYHLRRFKPQRLSRSSILAASYAELRHHLYESGRMKELSEATTKLTRYALSHIKLQTRIPTNKEALEERITLLFAVPNDRRPKVLEYQLARCLLERGAAGDKELALDHARRGTGRHPHSAAWILRINLEYELKGINTALPVINEALRNVRADEDASPIYVRAAEILAKADRLDEAITLLEKGIAMPGMRGLSSLYQSCAEMLAKAGRLDDAITKLEVGIAVPGMTSLSSLYQSCAEMLAKAGRLDDAIMLLEKGIEKIPADKNLFSLYQAAIELAARAGDYPKMEALVIKGLAEIPKNIGRNKIVETALRVFSARLDTAAIQRLLGRTGPQQLDPPQRALADYLLVRLSGDWAKAIEVAQKGRASFPTYMSLQTSEIDARLALEQVKEAHDLVKDYRVGGHQLRDNSAVWFKAYVSLIAGQLEEAKSLAALYAPNDFDPGRPLDEAEMLRLWAVARNGMNTPVEAYFPGLAEYRRRIAAESQTVEQTPVAQTSKQTCVLVVATEWDSRHGGLSTFNRDLCAALAGAGARVVCYLPEASTEEKRRAEQVGVELIEAMKMPGIKDTALLAYPPDLPAGFLPDVVIGHDRITGAASLALVRHHYPGSKRVLFIHTSPEEIEWHKEPREDSTGAARAAERKQEQLGLAEGCDLVVAVGPHLASEFATDLYGAGNRVPLMELTPGLPQYPDNFAAAPPPSIRCLVLGRMEDYQLKGLDLAAKAFGRVVTGWRQVNPPKLVVRGAPVGTDDALRQRLAEDSTPAELDVIIRYYSANEIEIRKDLREASLVLMPSKTEGFGLVGLEAIACGVPTLISAQSGLAKTVAQHAPQLASEWVLPVSGDSVNKWAERIEFLLTGRDGAFARAAALRDKLASELDWGRAAADLLREIAPVAVGEPA